jgi:hypothetical protein
MAVEYVVLSSTGFVMQDGQLRGTGFFAFIEDGEFAFTYFIAAAHTVWSGHRTAII